MYLGMPTIADVEPKDNIIRPRSMVGVCQYAMMYPVTQMLGGVRLRQELAWTEFMR
jgi:hypothetical protein